VFAKFRSSVDCLAIGWCDCRLRSKESPRFR